MPCPNCDCTLQGVDSPHATIAYFHCPRCGTFVVQADGLGDTVYTPMLVKRCRVFEKQLADPAQPLPHVSDWHRLGIDESINKPGERP